MFTKSAIAAALVVGSLSSAFAFNNVGEISEAPAVTANRAMSAYALDSRAQAQVRGQRLQVYVDPAWLDHPTSNISSQ